MEKDNFIFGIRAITEAIRSDKQIDRVLMVKGLKGELYMELFELLKLHQVPIQQVPAERIDRVTRKNHQGVVAFMSEITYLNLEEIVQRVFESGETPLILVLDQITDVRNFGAISRTAECTGVHAIVIPERGAAQINADAMKTSAGALNHIPVCRVKNLHNAVKFLQMSGLQIVAVTEKTQGFYYENDFTAPTALVMGAEDTGISNDIIRIADVHTKIPLLGKVESLNVSVATAVVLYEAIKQRQASKA